MQVLNPIEHWTALQNFKAILTSEKLQTLLIHVVLETCGLKKQSILATWAYIVHSQQLINQEQVPIPLFLNRLLLILPMCV